MRRRLELVPVLSRFSVTKSRSRGIPISGSGELLTSQSSNNQFNGQVGKRPNAFARRVGAACGALDRSAARASSLAASGTSSKVEIRPSRILSPSGTKGSSTSRALYTSRHAERRPITAAIHRKSGSMDSCHPSSARGPCCISGGISFFSMRLWSERTPGARFCCLRFRPMTRTGQEVCGGRRRGRTKHEPQDSNRVTS